MGNMGEKGCMGVSKQTAFSHTGGGILNEKGDHRGIFQEALPGRYDLMAPPPRLLMEHTCTAVKDTNNEKWATEARL